MDWSIVHSLNGFLFRNDPIEDPLLWYVNAAEALYLLLLVVLFLFARHDRFASVRRRMTTPMQTRINAKSVPMLVKSASDPISTTAATAATTTPVQIVVICGVRKR